MSGWMVVEGAGIGVGARIGVPAAVVVVVSR